MLKFIKLTIPTTVILASITTLSANATPMKAVKNKDGTYRGVEIDTGDRYLSTKCGNISASIMSGKTTHFPPMIMVTMGVRGGEQLQSYRMFDVAKDSLTPDHTTKDMKVGCLTEKGGVGIYLPSTNPDTPPAYIQIDAKGRVFTGWDQAGLKLIAQPQK